MRASFSGGTRGQKPSSVASRHLLPSAAPTGEGELVPRFIDGQEVAPKLFLLEHGEWLRNPRNAGTDPAIDSEEVHFILALHYLQARDAGALPAAGCVSRYAELLATFRKRWPSSLKLATLEALAP